MPTSAVVVLDSIAAARPALSGAVVLHARNADRAADARHERGPAISEAYLTAEDPARLHRTDPRLA